MRKLLPFIGSTFLSSCYSSHRYVNSPAPASMPYFNKKGQSDFSAYYSSGTVIPKGYKQGKGFDLQSAYALSNHWAVTLEHSSRWEKDKILPNSYYDVYDSSLIKYKRNITSIGGGYFFPNRRSGKSYLNIYAGAGFGNNDIKDSGRESANLYSSFHKSQIIKYYLQPGFTFFSDKISIAAAIRFSFIRYIGIKTNYNEAKLKQFDLYDLDKRTATFFEPSYSILIVPFKKTEWLKIKGVLSCAIPYSDYDLYLSRFFCGSAGFSFDFTKMKNK